jgi:predicted permease
MSTLAQDLRYAFRMLRGSPGFTAVAVITLALGIGANTAIFSLVDAFLLRRLPVKSPEQLVFINRVSPTGRVEDDFPYPTFEQFRDHNQSFSGLFAWDEASAAVTVDSQSAYVPADFVSGSYFDVLGVDAMLGRTFTSDDDEPGRKPVAVISYSYWQRQFAGNPTAIGKTIYLGGIPFTVIGVTPRWFFGRNVAGRSADVVLPMFVHPQLALKDHNTFEIMGRLEPGVTLEHARADLDVIYRRALTEVAGARISPQVERQIHAQRIELKPGLRGASGLSEEFGTELNILMAVVGIALLIASVNIANLLLARAASRQKEIAVRLAVGASRGQLVRQFLTESALLSVLGGALGLLFAEWGVGFLLTVLSYGRAAASLDLEPDVRILGFTFGVSLLTGVLCGLGPAIRATRVDLNPVLKGTGSRESRPLRHGLAKSLVVSQVALSLTLLIGAGLLIRSLRQLYQVDTGFNRDKVLVGWVIPVLAGYDHTKEMRLYKELLEKLNAIPGVRSASLSRYRLLFARPDRNLWVQGSASVVEADREVYCYPVGPRFFETQGIGLLLGRGFSPADAETAPRVAVISESLAREFFPNKEPIGRRLGFGKPDASGDFQIVGVARDIQPHLREQQPLRAVYIPYTQAFPDDYGQMTFVVRTALDPSGIVPAVRHQVQLIDNNLPLGDIKTQAADADEKLGDERALATLLGLFAALGLLLASIGLYGTISYGVARRTNEVGIRMALGARKEDMLHLVLCEALSLVAIGVAIGVPLSIAGARLISTLIFGVKPADPGTISFTSAVMLAVASLAAYVPARRATKVDPMVALRYE